VVIGYYVRYYLLKLSEKIQNDTYYHKFLILESLLRSFVEAAKQNPQFSEWTGSQLKEYVMNLAMAKVEELKLPLTRDDVDALIEAAVLAFKQRRAEN
jgi:hypothetical protein